MRNILKAFLLFLSKRAIKKHDIKIVIVTGWLGAEIVKEGIYTVLSDKFIVRRNIKEIWWDFSIPLNILGYKDKQRNIFKWLILLIRSIYVLIFEVSKPHILVLAAKSERILTAEYWASFEPDQLVIVNNHKHSEVIETLLMQAIESKSTIIAEEDQSTKIPKKLLFSFGKKSSAVNYSIKDKISIEYKNKRLKISSFRLTPIDDQIFAAIFASCIKLGLNFEDIIAGMSKFDYRNLILKKIGGTV